MNATNEEPGPSDAINNELTEQEEDLSKLNVLELKKGLNKKIFRSRD